MKNSLKFSVTLSLLVLVIACKNEQEQENTKKIKSVATAIAESVDYQREVFATGRVSLSKEVKLSFKTGGIIAQVFVDEGQRVQPGQTLARLKLDEIKAQTDNASLQYNKVQRDLDRTQALFKDSVATLEQLQNAKTQVQAARNSLESAGFNLRYSEIKAPYKGIVLTKLADENELVGSGNPVFYFGALSNTKRIIVNLTAREIGKIALGNSARVVFDALPDLVFKGKVTEKNEIADMQTNTFSVEISLDDPDGVLYSGFVGKAYIAVAGVKTAIKIPIDALKYAQGEQAAVFVLRNGIAQKKDVNVFTIDGKYILLKDGLEIGDEVITEGVGYIKQGDSLTTRTNKQNSAQ
ncbi:efflux RND transporter periplasmic adaptor subunit [Winogradskyella endarachnes]|nr:efflux RND transporter periplasmic adaptor subunit [Winogradskyella endarachnes]